MFGDDADEALIASGKAAPENMDYTAGPRRWRSEDYLDPEAVNYAAISVCSPEDHGIDANGDRRLVYRRTKATHRATLSDNAGRYRVEGERPGRLRVRSADGQARDEPGEFSVSLQTDRAGH